MTITNVVSAINEVTVAPTTLTINTTSTRLAPYVLEGIEVPSKNQSNALFDFRVAVDPENIVGGTIVEGAVKFHLYAATSGSNYAHDVWALVASDGTTLLRLQRDSNSETHRIYWSDTDGTESNYVVSMASNGLHRWDILWKIAADGTGYFNMKVDGASIWSMSGQNNGRGSAVFAVQWRRESNITSDRVISGIICADEDTTDMTIVQQKPTGDGAVAAWTGSYTEVDENGAAYADSIYSTTSGQIELMTYPVIPAGPASDTDVKGVFIRAVAYGLDGIKAEARVGSTNYELGTICGPNTYKANKLFSQLTNPATAGAWTVATIDAAQFGFKVT